MDLAIFVSNSSRSQYKINLHIVLTPYICMTVQTFQKFYRMEITDYNAFASDCIDELKDLQDKFKENFDIAQVADIRRTAQYNNMSDIGTNVNYLGIPGRHKGLSTPANIISAL